MATINSGLYLLNHHECMGTVSNTTSDAPTHFERGNHAFDQRNYQSAIASYRKALHLNPQMLEALFKCGVAFHQLGHFEEATSYYRQAIDLNPQLAEIHFNLADAYAEMKLFAQAESTYLKTLRLQPNNAAAAYNLGCLYKTTGNYSEAVSAYQRALQIRPDYAEALIQIGLIWKMQNRLEQALICFEQGLQCKPDLVEAHYNLGLTYQLLGDISTARQCYRRALDHNPNYMPARWMYLLALPILYADENEIQRERARFSANLKQLADTTALNTFEEKQRALQGIAAYSNFYLPYQGQNDRELQTTFGRLVVKIMAANFPQWSEPKPMPAVTAGNRIRIGYVSNYMHAHTVGVFLMGWLKHVNKEHVELFCYHLNERKDECTAQIEQAADHFHHVTGSVDKAATQIHKDDLHILIHTDIGMTSNTLQLAGLRLAPIQCAFWGHPVTSGLPTIDYFLSSDLMEPPDGHMHYCETLIRLPNLALNYSAPALPATPKTRRQLDIPESATVYLSSQSLFKYLPQHDDIYPRIAKEVPDALFVFISHSNGHVTEQFRRRLKSAFQQHGVPARILMMPRLGHTDFLSLNLAADVLLDTLEWSGGHTCLEALSCNLPVVTLPGAFMRGRHTYAFLTRMGVTQTIAADKDGYIGLAVRLGRDMDFRNSIKDQIKKEKAKLFNDQSVNDALEQFFKNVNSFASPFPKEPISAEQIASLFASAAQLQARDKLGEAAMAYQRILDNHPNCIGVLNNLGNIFTKQGRHDKAIHFYRRMVDLGPDMPQAHYNLGSALRHNENFSEALFHLQRAVDLQPDFAEAWNNLALTWKNIGHLDSALHCFSRSVELAPKLALARWNRSFVYMLKQDYEHGWLDFLWRFAIPNWKTIYPFRLKGRRWDGRPAPGQTILVHDEQGLGDTLQFVRYLPLVRRRCARVVLETRKELIEVLRTAEGIDELIERSSNGQPKADFHVYVALMSLPLLFGTTYTTVPNQVPYLNADPAKTAQWRQRWSDTQPRVGLMWAGRPQHTNDHNRSIPLAQLTPLLRVPGIEFIGLQKGPGAEQLKMLPPDIHLTNIGEALHDFSDTAACLANLDLVITVDTAVAHLAGAMGRPVWMLVPFIPDWRWGMESSDTPWYPTMRLFRQPRGKAWEPVVATVTQALRDHFSTTQIATCGEMDQ